MLSSDGVPSSSHRKGRARKLSDAPLHGVPAPAVRDHGPPLHRRAEHSAPKARTPSASATHRGRVDKSQDLEVGAEEPVEVRGATERSGASHPRALGTTLISFLALLGSTLSLLHRLAREPGRARKSRSSSPALLGLCRRFAAIRAACGVRILLRWVPSGWNVADGPSRGAGVGDHPADGDEKPAPRPHAYLGQG